MGVRSTHLFYEDEVSVSNESDVHNYSFSSIQLTMIIFQCPAETESLESLDIFKDQIPEGVQLHSLR